MARSAPDARSVEPASAWLWRVLGVAALLAVAIAWFALLPSLKDRRAPLPTVASGPPREIGRAAAIPPPVSRAQGAVTAATPQPAPSRMWEEAAPPPEPPPDPRPVQPVAPPPGLPFSSQTLGEPPSEMERLRARAESWRARYRPVAERVARLEKEIPDLERQASRIGSIVEYTNMPTPKDPKIKTEAEAILDRLDRARAELKQQKAALDQIEEAARRDGVSSGQLY